MLRRIVHFRQAEEYLAARTDRPTYLKAREYLSAWDAETRRRSFFSARCASADILSELHGRCQQVIDGDMTDTQARELLRVFLENDGAAALRQMGFLPQGEAAQSVAELASVRRLQLILYQNAKIATEAGHYRQWAENAALFPYGRWHLGHAEEHRPEHAARDGKVYAFEHPIWRTSPPGSEFNCHCWREELTAEEAAGLTVQPNDQTIPTPTVDFDPGAPLDVPPPVKARTPPGIKAAVEKAMAEGNPRAVIPPAHDRLIVHAQEVDLSRVDDPQRAVVLADVVDDVYAHTKLKRLDRIGFDIRDPNGDLDPFTSWAWDDGNGTVNIAVKGLEKYSLQEKRQSLFSLIQAAEKASPESLPEYEAEIGRTKREIDSIDSGRRDFYPEHSAWAFANLEEGVIRHELGHVFNNQNRAAVNSFFASKQMAEGEMIEAYGVTDRGRHNWDECMAENFALYSGGKREHMHPDMIEFLKAHTSWES